MKQIFYPLLFLSIALVVLYSCEEKKNQSESSDSQDTAASVSQNPNGDSELALLMREMYLEAAQIKKQVKRGEAVQVKLDHGKILSAHATEPEKAQSKAFKDFAKMYLANLDQLQKADAENVEMVFQSLVESCMSCHQEFCPGPMMRIGKLRI